MQLYRVFPHLPDAAPGEPGHPLDVHPGQGTGRWDNPDLYRALYVASEPAGAIGESFQSITHWNLDMLDFPALPGSEKRLGTYLLDEERYELLDLDDARVLLDRRLRPTDVVLRRRAHTQRTARDIHAEQRFAGMTFWSNVRPQWTVHVLWNHAGLQVERVERLPGHPGLRDAAERLFKPPLPPELT